MSMIEKLQKISREIFKNALKTHQLKDVILHKKTHKKNMLEILSLYPNKGVGFHIRRKTMPNGMFYAVKFAKFKSLRNGKLTVVKHVQDMPVDEFPKRLTGCNKRAVWDYDFGEFESFQTDNRVKYTRADYEAFHAMRRIGNSQYPASKSQQPTQTTQDGSQQFGEGESSEEPQQ